MAFRATKSQEDPTSCNPQQPVEGAAHFDNRATTLLQREQQSIIENSPHSMALAQCQAMTVNRTPALLDNRMEDARRYPVQCKRYNVERNIALKLATKEWEAQEADPEKNKRFQSAKTRAKGAMLGDLRVMYPTDYKGKDFDTKEASRGKDYLREKAKIELKFDAVPDEQETVSTSRTAIFEGASEGSRTGGSQASGVSKLTGKKYIGAHLVKREWGGADNMWNVVAWPQKAEDKWAKGFELSVDRAGLFGEDPGAVSISVTKEDEVVSQQDVKNEIDDVLSGLKDNAVVAATERTKNPNFIEAVNSTRWKVNRAVESVPLIASGTNKDGVTTLNSTETAYDVAEQKAREAIVPVVKKEIVKTADKPRHKMAPPLPGNLVASDEEKGAKRKEERTRDWQNERDTYGKGFTFEDTVIDG